MIKICISGKAKSGKDTLSLFLQNNLKLNKEDIKSNSFAAPMKEIISIMFPQANKENLYGESSFREDVIANDLIDKEGNQLTYRKALTDLGAFARSYNENVWINCLNSDFQKLKYKKAYFISDLRFKNEFIWAKNNGFVTIRIRRADSLKSSCVSEMEQDEIADNQFDFVIKNNKSLDHLNEKAIEIIKQLNE